MSNRRFLIVLFLLIFSLNSYCIFRWIEIPDNRKIPFNYEELQTGDLVLRRSKGLISRWYAAMSQHDPYFSHAGVVLINEDTVRIISATQDHIPSGLISQDPAVFLSKDIAEAFAVYRPRFNENQKQLLQLEMEKDLKKNLQFDSHYRMDENPTYYCTEYIYRKYICIAPEMHLTLSYLDEWVYVAPDDLYREAGHDLIYSTRSNQ